MSRWEVKPHAAEELRKMSWNVLDRVIHDFTRSPGPNVDGGAYDQDSDGGGGVCAHDEDVSGLVVRLARRVLTKLAQTTDRGGQALEWSLEFSRSSDPSRQH